MNDALCNYDGRRDEVLVAYLYDDIDPEERAAFEQHLAGCVPCRAELDALADVREGLARWATPEVANGVGGRTPRAVLRLVDAPQASPGGWRRFSEAPVWLQAAAAMLAVAASLGIANINLTYSNQGLVVTTGWMRSAPAPPAAEQTAREVKPSATPWHADMTALEEKLLQQMKAQPAASPVSASDDDEALWKRVRALLQESERRQQRELALRVAEVARDAQTQRQADLLRIDRSLGIIQSRTGVEVMRTQQQLNNLAQRVSQQR